MNEPSKILQDEPSGFRLCIYWIHPVLQELSPCFSQKHPNLIKSYKKKLKDPNSPLYLLCKARVENEKDEVNTKKPNSSFFKPQTIWDTSLTIKVEDIQALDNSHTKYMCTWQDCDKTDLPMLKQLQSDTRDYLRHVFHFKDEQLINNSLCHMCFHTTTAVRNPKFNNSSDRGQYLHLHLQVYGGKYVPSMSCMQRSIQLQHLIGLLEEDSNSVTMPSIPHTYYDETVPDPYSDKSLYAMLASRQRYYAEGFIPPNQPSLINVLSQYYGLADLFSSWPYAEVIKMIRNSWQSALQGNHWSDCGWTLDQRLRSSKTSCRLHFIIGCKGSGKTTYGKKLIGDQTSKDGRSIMWIDGTPLKFQDSNFFSSCLPPERYKFKQALFRWAVRYGFDIIISTNNHHGAVEQTINALSEEITDDTCIHNLRYNVNVHVVAAPWYVCHKRVLARNRPNDSDPSSREFHKRVYLKVLNQLDEYKGTNAISTLVLIDNRNDDATLSEGGVQIDNTNSEVLIASDMQVSKKYCHFLHYFLGDHQQFDLKIINKPKTTVVTDTIGLSKASLHKKFFVVIRGAPGVGKSTLWKHLFNEPLDFSQDDTKGNASFCAGVMPSALQHPSGCWYIIDGECFSVQYRKFWQISPGDDVVCCDGICRCRDAWKDNGLKEAFDNGANIIIPFTDDNAKAQRLQDAAFQKGYDVQVLILLADPNDVNNRLQRRNRLHGTPIMDFKFFHTCYSKILDQYKADIDNEIYVWTFKNSTWFHGISKLEEFTLSMQS